MSDPREDTIAAIATPPGAGALAIVRLSGPRAKAILFSLFDAADDAWPERTVRHGQLADVDDGLAWWSAAPRTFTGDEVAEFTGHGGARVTARVLEAFVTRGARLAEPGEFTRRAFLNGRLDLARAEAVADVIAASTDDALRVARAQLAGGLSTRITALREELLDALAHVEATVDFPDEDLHPDGNAALADRFDGIGGSCAALAATFRHGRLLREGARVVLAGRPNVGKSSLLNALAGRNRAIVTDEPGTTRDVVEEALDLEGLPVILTDTAGLRGDASGAAEAEGIRRSRDAASEADLVLLVYDAATGFGAEDRAAADAVAAARARGPVLVVANKSDLAAAEETDAASSLRVSARTGAGLDALVAAIVGALRGSAAAENSGAEGVVVTRARHHDALTRAGERARAAAAAARRGESPDLVASDARRALDALGEIVGAVTTEDLLGRIFERFCVGK